MKQVFKQGDSKTFNKIVQASEIAAFESGTIHSVYSTFALAKDAEWSGRLFVLDMKENDEEGIGTHIHIEHKSPAFVGNEVCFTASFQEITDKGEIVISFKAHVADRLIAIGTTGQRILKKERIEQLFNSIE